MNTEQLTELEKAATPGPWEVDAGCTTYICVPLTRRDPRHQGILFEAEDGSPHDAALIVALRNAAPELLAAIKEADNQIGNALMQVDDLVRDKELTAPGHLRSFLKQAREALRALNATGGGDE